MECLLLRIAVTQFIWSVGRTGGSTGHCQLYWTWCRGWHHRYFLSHKDSYGCWLNLSSVKKRYVQEVTTGLILCCVVWYNRWHWVGLLTGVKGLRYAKGHKLFRSRWSSVGKLTSCTDFRFSFQQGQELSHLTGMCGVRFWQFSCTLCSASASSFFRRVRRITKATMGFVISVCRPHGTTWLLLDGFARNLTLEDVCENSSRKFKLH